MNQLRQHIKNVIIEENQNKDVKLVKQMIYDLFDEVSFIEQSTYNDGKPLLFIYFDSDDPAANIESWFDEHISSTIMDYTGGHLVVCPYWVPEWDFRKKIVDVYISTLKLKYDNLDNVINESEKKRGSLLSIIKDIVEPFEEKDVVCGIDVNYDQEDDMYTVMINIGTKNLNKIFHPLRELQRNWYVDDIRKEVKNEIIGLIPIKNIYVGSTGVNSCDGTINESSEKNKLKNPIKYFYKNFLKGEPIEYKGILLYPTYQQDEDVITWTIENPEDHSFNGELIKELVVNEFRDFCSFVGLDFYKLYKRTDIIENMPKGRFYLNKDDKNFIETTLKNKKYLEFEINGSEYMLNFEYKNFGIHINYDVIEVGTSGYFKGVKIKLDTGKEELLDYKFIEKMSDHEFDEFREHFLFNDFYSEVMNHLRTNPRFYDSRVDMWDFSLQPLKTDD